MSQVNNSAVSKVVYYRSESIALSSSGVQVVPNAAALSTILEPRDKEVAIIQNGSIGNGLDIAIYQNSAWVIKPLSGVVGGVTNGDKMDVIVSDGGLVWTINNTLKNLWNAASNFVEIWGGTLLAHLTDTNNPHKVTKSQVGLSKVPNTDFTDAVNLNTLKRSYPIEDRDKLAGITGVNTGDQDLSGKQNVLTAGNNILIINDVIHSEGGVISPVSDSKEGIVDNILLQELGGVDKTINGVRIGRGNNNIGGNTVIGENSLNNNITGTQNTAIGLNSLYNNTDGNQNTAIGLSSLSNNQNGSENTAVGNYSLSNNQNGNENVAIGLNSLYNNTDGSKNTSLGVSSLHFNGGGNENIAVGHSSLRNNTTGGQNTAVGVDSLYNNTDGYANTAIGLNSLNNNTVGTENTAVGSYSLNNNTDGIQNTALGNYSLYSNTSGTENIAVGYCSLHTNTTGVENTALGSGSLGLNTNGNSNIAIGHGSLYHNTVGNSNTAIGWHALSNVSGNPITNGNFNTAVGSYSGAVQGASNSIAIGAGAVATTSFTAVLGSTNIVSTILRGVVNIKRLLLNGQSATNSPLGIPPSAVQVTSNQTSGDFRNTNGVLSFFNVIWRNFLFSTGNPDLVGTGVRGLQTDASGNVSTLAYQQLVTGRVTLVAGVATVKVAGLTAAGNAMGSIRTSGGTGGGRYRFVCSAVTLTITALDASGGTVTTDTSELYYLIEML